MEKQIVVFELGNEHFGIEIACVDGIVKMQEITRVPYALNYVVGITSLRGSVIPVIDLAKRLEMDEFKQTNESRIVVVMKDSQKIGMIVTAVSEVLTIDDNIIEPPPPMVANINAEFVCGIARLDQRLVILLNLDSILGASKTLVTS